MGLNIKNEHTHELVRKLAALTGQSQTGAVEDAVRRRLAELETRQSTKRHDVQQALAVVRETMTGLDRARVRQAYQEMHDDRVLPR